MASMTGCPDCLGIKADHSITLKGQNQGTSFDGINKMPLSPSVNQSIFLKNTKSTVNEKGNKISFSEMVAGSLENEQVGEKILALPVP